MNMELPDLFTFDLYLAKLYPNNDVGLLSPVNLAFDLSLIAFYDFIFVSCLSCLEVCPNESLPKSDDRNMFKFAFEI